MTILEHPEAQALLEDALLSQEQLAELSGRLNPFLERYLPLFQRAEQRTHAWAILVGKLSSLSRKTAEPIANLLNLPREPLQDFVGSSPWKDRLILDALRQHVVERWHDPDGVFSVDGSGFPKKGTEPCGVKRQYCGRLGKIDNCQVGIFLAYSCRYGHTLLEHRLFLPKEWTEDKARRKKARVPEEVVYQDAWEIALEQIDRCREGVPHSWVTADAEFGRVNAFRAGLRERQERYVVDVRSDLRLRDLRAKPPERKGNRGRKPSVPAQTSAQEWALAQPAGAWKRLVVRAGEKQPLVVEAAETQVQTFEEGRVGPEERFLVVRTVDNPEPKTWYCLSNAAAEVPLAKVVQAHAQRYWEEDSFKEGKSEIGLDEYEVRSWVGWHHHMTLSLLALWFLVSERDLAQKTTPALTVSVLREAFSRLLLRRFLTPERIEYELNATLRRKEEARIYHYYQRTGRFPPRRGQPQPAESASSADGPHEPGASAATGADGLHPHPRPPPNLLDNNPYSRSSSAC